jgi:TP901 family phage tail tape measure protein
MADDKERIVSGRLEFDVSKVSEQLKELSDAVQQAKQQLTSKPSGNIWFDELGGTIQSAIAKVQVAAKQGIISLAELEQKLLSIKNIYGQAGAFDPQKVGAPQAIANEKAITDALIQAEKQRTAIYQAEQRTRLALEKQAIAEREALEKEYDAWWQNALKQQEQMDKLHYLALQENAKRDAQAKAQAIDNELRQVKEFYNMRLITAQEALQRLEQLMNEETAYFQQNQDKQIQILKTAYSIEESMYAEQRKALSGNSGGFQRMHMNGFGMMNPIGMAEMMLQFEAMHRLLDNLRKGIVGVDQAEAGLKQVFGETAQTQEQLNAVTNDFINVGKMYGQTVQEITDAAKQWGRQYKDVNTALELTRAATILATVDNLSMADANRSLEATMNAMGMAATDQASAMENSMKIVDSWSALAHEASVSAQDLAMGVERSAGAAHQAGMNIDQLNALIAAGIRNTGLSGENIGNMWKTVIANIAAATPQVQNAFKQLGIDMYTTGENGKKEMKPVYDLIIELSEAAKTASTEQSKYFETIAGGKYQYSKFMSAIADTKTIQDDLTKSMESGGKATQLVQDQMHTLHAELVRLADTIQQIGHNATSGGLGEVVKSFVVDLRYLIEGLQQIPAPFVAAGVGAIAFIGVLKLLGSAFGGLRSLVESYIRTMATARGIKQALIAVTNGEAAANQSFTATLLQKINAERADVVAQQAQRQAAIGTTAAMETEALAARQLQVAITGVDIAAGALTAGLTLVLGIGSMVATNVGSMTEVMAENQQQMSEMTAAYQKHRNEVDSLLKSYQQLDNATKGGTVFADDKQQQEYYDTMQKIANILPNVVEYTDENGRAHIRSAQAIKEEIDQQQKLMQLKAQDTVANFKIDYKNTLDHLKSLKEQVEQLNQQISSGTTISVTSVVASETGRGDIRKLTERELYDLRNRRYQLTQELDATNQEVRQKMLDFANALASQSGVQLNEQSQGLLQRLIGDVDWDKVGNDANKVQSTIQQIVNTVIAAQKASKDGQMSNDAYAESYAKLSQTIPMTSQAMKDFTNATNSSTSAAKSNTDAMAEITAAVQDAIKNNKLLLEAEQQLSNTHKISQSTLSQLIAKYPDFVNVLNQGEAAIKDWINAKEKDNAVTIQTEKSKTEAVINETKARIQAMMDEIAALNALAAAHKSLVYGVMNGLAPGIDALNPNLMYTQKANALSRDVADAQKELQSLYKQLDYVNNAFKAVTIPQYGVDGGSSSSKKKTDPMQQYLDAIRAISQKDDDALLTYERRVTSTSNALDVLDKKLSTAIDTFKSHMTSTKAAKDVLNAYHNDIKGLQANINALTQENSKLKSEISGVQKEIAKVNDDFKHGRIDAKTHTDALRELNQEYDRLTNKLNSNTQAIEKNKDAMAQAAQSVRDSMVEALRSAYEDEQKLTEQALANIYEPQIKALQEQKDAIDEMIQSLQEQWQIEDEMAQLSDLQSQLAAVEADKRYQIVTVDGKLEYTYDTARAAELQKQIDDQQKKIQRDKQLQELQHEKDALDKRLQNLQDFYDQAKQKLDDYWSYKLSQDNLNYEVDYLIEKNGLDKAFAKIDDYATKVINRYNAIEQAANAAAAAIAMVSSLGSSGIGDLTLNPDVQNAIATLQQQGLLPPDIAQFDTGGYIPPGKEGLVYLHENEVIAPSPLVDKLNNLVINVPRMPAFNNVNTTTQTMTIQINGNLEFPNVRNGNDAMDFLDQLISGVRRKW